MYRYCFLLLFISYEVICDDCVVFNFENNYNEIFTNSGGLCNQASSMWNLNQYSSSTIDPPHESSTSFISPATVTPTSCVTSHMFTVEAGGTFDIVLYVEPILGTDLVTIFLLENSDTGFVTHVTWQFMLSNQERGWVSRRVTLTTNGAVFVSLNVYHKVYSIIFK